jgi:hypothetical protein
MIPTSRTNKRGDRRARQNKRSGSSQAITSLTMTEMNERQLAVRKDRVMLRGKQLFAMTTNTSGLFSSALNASVFGSRVFGILRYFQRWKIIKLQVKIFIPTAGFSAYVGVGDDPSAVGPSNPEDVLELRCSRAITQSGADSNEFQWNPVDPDKWYYTADEGATGDVRLTAPAQIAAAHGVAGTYNVLLYYTIEGEGAESLSV